jgi:methionine-S-sulfoxide reductase
MLRSLLFLALYCSAIATTTKRAVFAGGCFWGTEDAFRHQFGVVDTAVGFMGGHVDSPTYREVYTDETGHAEVVVVDYNPDAITYP